MCSDSWELDSLRQERAVKVAPGRGNQHSHGAGHGDGRGAMTEAQGDGNKTECILGNRNEDTFPGRQGRVRLLKDG